MKKCYKCGETKELGMFNNNRSAWDGKQSECRICAKQIAKAKRKTPEARAKRRLKALKLKDENPSKYAESLVKARGRYYDNHEENKKLAAVSARRFRASPDGQASVKATREKRREKEKALAVERAKVREYYVPKPTPKMLGVVEYRLRYSELTSEDRRKAQVDDISDSYIRAILKKSGLTPTHDLVAARRLVMQLGREKRAVREATKELNNLIEEIQK